MFFSRSRGRSDVSNRVLTGDYKKMTGIIRIQQSLFLGRGGGEGGDQVNLMVM